jgi:hypothetical protein
VLAIPDLNHYARHEHDAEVATRPESSSSVSSRRQRAVFKKTVMKLNGNVRWGVGLVFERNLDNGQRSFNFIPHYNVSLKNPKYAKSLNGKVRYAQHSCTWNLLTKARSTMLSGASAVITYTCQLLLLLRMIENGLSPIWSHRKRTTAFISRRAFSPTSTAGGRCSLAPCPCLLDKASCGLA